MMNCSVESKMIEWLRPFLMFLVVFLHSVGMPMSGNKTISFHNGEFDTLRIAISEGICHVAVPTFFLISGFLFCKNIEKWNWLRWGNKVKRRVRTLLAPYVFWNLLNAIFNVSILYLLWYYRGGENLTCW